MRVPRASDEISDLSSPGEGGAPDCPFRDTKIPLPLTLTLPGSLNLICAVSSGGYFTQPGKRGFRMRTTSPYCDGVLSWGNVIARQ